MDLVIFAGSIISCGEEGTVTPNPITDTVTVSVGDTKIKLNYVKYEDLKEIVLTSKDKIYYSLDGKEPTINPLNLYNKPISQAEILQNISTDGKFTLNIGRYVADKDIFELLAPYNYIMYFEPLIKARDPAKLEDYEFDEPAKLGTAEIEFYTENPDVNFTSTWTLEDGTTDTFTTATAMLADTDITVGNHTTTISVTPTLAVNSTGGKITSLRPTTFKFTFTKS
jgi:hypothetical protein